MSKKSKVILTVFKIILICLTFASLNLAQAKFVKTSRTKENSAGIAKYIFISSPSTDKNLKIDCSTNTSKSSWTISYPFSISNSNDDAVSEVAISYEVVISIPTPLVNGVTMSLLCNDLVLIAKQSTSTTFTFDGYADFSAGVSNSHFYSIIFTVDATVIVNMFELNQISIDINSSQVD